MLMLSTGPSQVGPLRDPIRNSSWLALAVIVISCVLLSRSLLPSRFTSRPAFFVYGFITLISYWFAFRGTPQFKGPLFVALVVQLAVSYLILRRASRAASHVKSLATFGMALLISTVSIGMAQTWYFAGRSAPFGWRLESQMAILKQPVPGARGEMVVIGSLSDLTGSRTPPREDGVGDPPLIPSGFWDETSAANLWYLKEGVTTLNRYTAVGDAAASTDLCMQTFYGFTCDAAFAKLFEVDPETGLPIADLLSIDTIQVLIPNGKSAEDVLRTHIAPGTWHVSKVGTYAVTWMRNEPTASIGGPTWASPGLGYTLVSQSSTSVTLKIDTVPPKG
jgi:hypothetical protein